jgi:hypothetical protein
MQMEVIPSSSGTYKSVSLAQVKSEEVHEGEASYMLHEFVTGCENDPIYGSVSTKDLAWKCFGWGETVDTSMKEGITKFPTTSVKTAAPFLYEHVVKEVVPLAVNQRLECNKVSVNSSGLKMYLRCNVPCCQTKCNLGIAFGSFGRDDRGTLHLYQVYTKVTVVFTALQCKHPVGIGEGYHKGEEEKNRVKKLLQMKGPTEVM